MTFISEFENGKPEAEYEYKTIDYNDNREGIMRKGIKLLLALTCIWLIGYIITNYLLVWNVFDEIYYSRYGMKIFRPNCASYENMSQWEGLSRDDERIFYSDGFFKNYYQEEYLGENAYLIIYLNKKRKVVEIGYLYEYEDFNEIYDYTYDVRKKC